MATIGIVSTVQDLNFFTHGYFRTILTSAGQTTVGQDCLLRLVSLTHDEFQHVESAQMLLAAQQCDAILVVAPHDIFLPTIAELFTMMPGVIIAPPRLDLDLSYVTSDNYDAGRQIVRHLLGRGRRRIVLAQPFPLSGDFWERERGYQAQIAEAGLEPLTELVHYPLSDALIERVLAHHADGLIAPNDNDALGMIVALQRYGVAVPGQISVVGFDDEEFAADVTPSITTVRQPTAEIAMRATRYLIERLAGRERGIYREILPATLIARGSS